MIRKILMLLLSISLVTAQDQESFNAILKVCQFSLSDEEQNDAVLRWEGVKTWEGFDLVVEELLKNVGGNRRGNSFYILKRMELAPAEMVDRLLTGAKIALNEPGSLPLHLAILDKFPEDDRIIAWLAGLLNDQRLVPDPPKKRGEDRSGGQTARVCDCASGTIVRMLIARKQIPYEGLGVGDPSLEYEYSGRDRHNLAVAKKLNELGFHVKEPTSTSTAPSDPRPVKKRVEVGDEPGLDPVKTSLASDSTASGKPKQFFLIEWTIGGIFSLLLAFYAVRKIVEIKYRTKS